MVDFGLALGGNLEWRVGRSEGRRSRRGPLYSLRQVILVAEGGIGLRGCRLEYLGCMSVKLCGHLRVRWNLCCYWFQGAQTPSPADALEDLRLVVEGEELGERDYYRRTSSVFHGCSDCNGRSDGGGGAAFVVLGVLVELVGGVFGLEL